MPSLNTACPKYSQPPTTLQSASMLWESLHDTWPHGCNPLHEVSTSTETRTIMRELGSPAGRQWQTRGMLPFWHCYRACHSDSESSSPCPALLQSRPPLQLQINKTRAMRSLHGVQRDGNGRLDMLPFLRCYRACHTDSESSSPCLALPQSRPPLQLQINKTRATWSLHGKKSLSSSS